MERHKPGLTELCAADRQQPCLEIDILNLEIADRSRFNLEHRKQCPQMTRIESRLNHKTAAFLERISIELLPTRWGSHSAHDGF